MPAACCNPGNRATWLDWPGGSAEHSNDKCKVFVQLTQNVLPASIALGQHPFWQKQLQNLHVAHGLEAKCIGLKPEGSAYAW